MESGNGGASSKGILIPVPDSSDVFKSSILAPLQSAYLYDESKQFFRYKSAVLVKNSAQEEKYNAFRAKRREAGYSEEDLEESYGFLLFDDVSKANNLGATGVLTGNSTCTTLGDPSKGVYISMHSDCLDLNRWYHGKSGYIAIIRLTKGKVNKVSENYTQNFTAPTVGFDSHVSEQFPSVSAQTSSFLAFERTQCYMYELLDDGSNGTAQSPSAACPFAIVSFSYTDNKATIEPPQEKSKEKKLGQLQIGSQFYSVGLRSNTGALIPTKLPPVVKVDRSISMLHLRHLLPRAVFETCFTGEAFLDGLYCTLCELVSTEAEETNSLTQLLWKIKEKDLALVVLLNDGGFLILLHSTHFLTYDDIGSCSAEILQGLFVFPDSRVVMKDTKFGQKNSSMTSEILRILPVLSYAEGEIEKAPIDPSEELCEVLAQHMQSYTALINPGLASGPSREVSMFPFQYDVPDAHKHLYSSPEWTDGSVQRFRSYLSKPSSFQLPVSKASEILVAGQEERREDLDDDVYICLSSPEEVPISTVLDDKLPDLDSPDNVETSVDSGTVSTGAQDDLTAVPHNMVPNDLQPEHPTKDYEKCSDLCELNKTDNVEAETLLTPPTSDDLPAELIFSITSAEQSVTDETLNLTAKLQTAEVNSLSESDYTKKLLDIPEVTNFRRRKRRKMRRGPRKGWKKLSKVCVEASGLQAVKTPLEVDKLTNSQQDENTKELPGDPQLSNPPNWRKLQRRKSKCVKLSSYKRKLRSASILMKEEEKSPDPGLQSLESTILMELEVSPLRRKMERWDLKPIISECGRILVPFGSADIADQIKSLKDKLQSTKDEQCPEKMVVEAPMNAHDTVKIDLGSSTAPEVAVDEVEVTKTVDGGSTLQNITASDVNPEQNILRQSDDGNCSVPLNLESSSSKSNDTDTHPSQAVQEKHTDNLYPEKCPTKSEFLLRKLKSVLLRGKRKADLVTEDTTPNTPQDTEPSLKKSKEVDSETEVLKGSNTNAQSTNAAVNEVSTMLPVDPLFAYALGLTPKEIPEKVTKTQDQDTKQRTDSTKLQEQTFSDKQSEIIHKPVSIFTRRGRIKTLKKHQSVSAECIKKKWWLHFQTPACFASEKLNYKDCTSDNSVRKTVKEKMNSACSSADALNLLADLALGAGNDQVPPQPNPAFERKPETSLKKSDLKKDLTSAEQESVLHALLRKPSAKTTQPHESPAPSHLVVHSELVGLVSKEHAYSLPPSSSLLLGLPGTPFQVSPISGSSRLLHHHQTVYGIKALQPSPGQEDRSEHNRTPDYLKKHMMRKHKFRFSRTIVIKEGSIKVTRQWTENYDFNLDSKFTSDSKDKTVIRALHGPWDFSVQDTNEEVRLIVHMWIGLFYSRSTARFFHVDSSFKFPCSEESESFEMATGVISGLANSEHKATAPVSFASVTDTSDALSITALDLSKKDHATLDQDYVALDLSLRNSSAESFTSDPKIQKKETFEPSGRKESSETLNYLKSPQEHHECYGKMVNFKEIVSEVTNDRKDNENEKTGTPRKAVRLENADIPSSRVDGKVIPPQESINSASIKFNTTLAILAIGQVFNGCDKERINLEEATEKSGTEERGLIQQDVMDSFRSVTDEKEDFNMEAQDAIQTNDHEKNGSKNLGSYKIKENPCQEGNIDLSQKVDYASDDFANKESDIICNGNCLESKKLLSREERKEVSKEQAEHFKGVTDCSPKPEGEVIKEDNHLKKDQTDEKDECISVLKVDKDLSDQPLPEMCNGPELAQENCITQSNHQAQMNEQLSLVNSTKDAHDMPLKMLCSDGIVLTDDHAISEKVPHTLLEMDSLATESLSEEISKTGICLRDEEQFKKAVLPMSDESLSMPQTKVNFETENQNTDFNFGQCNDVHEEQENKSEEEEVKVDSVTQKEQCQHQPHSPHCEVSKMYETQVAFAKETDLGTDKTNEGLDKNHTGVEIPFIGIDTSREHEIQVKAGKATCIEPFQHKPHSPQCEAQQAFTNEAVLRADKTNHGLDKACTGVKFSFIGVDASGEDKIQNANHKEQFQHQPYAPQCEVPKTCREQVAFTKETDLKTDKTNERLDKCCTGVEIPFIGIHVTGEDTEQPHGSHTQGSAEEVVQGLEEIPFISDCSSLKAALPNEMCSVSQVCSEKAEPFKISLPDGNEIYQPLALGGESDNRCPTPTIDEKPYGYMSCSSPNGDTSAFSGSETGVNPDHKCLSTSITPVKDDLNCDKKLCHSSTVNCDSNPYPVFHPDELRTLRVLQSIDKFFYTDKSSQNETIKMKESVDQSPDPSKCIPGSLSSDEPSFDFKKKNTGNEKPAVVSASTSHILQKEPSDCLLVSPFKGKLEKVLGVKLQLKKTDSNSQDYFEGTNTQETSAGQDGRFYRPCPSELLQVITSSLDQDRPKPTSQSNVNQEPRPYSQRPVMAVKPSKSDERQVDSFSKDVHTEKFSKNKLPKCPKLVYTTPASMLIEKRTKEKSKGNSERLNDNHETSELSLKNNWFSNVSHSKSNSDDARFAILDPSYQCQRRDISKFNRIPSLAPSKQSFDSAECSSKLVDGIQSFLTNGLVEESEKKIKVSIEIDRKNSTDASASFMDHRDNELIDDDQILAPQSSLICTVYNTGQTKSHSFLEQVSQRCLQEDLTQASMEQECLIFSEQMKQLLKKMERGAIRQEDIHDNKRLSCTSPLTINFSNLDEQEDSLDHFDVSLVGQKIKVGLSKEDLTDTTEEEKTTHPRELSQGKYNTVELAWVSDMTAECARLYEAKMHDVCAFKNVSSRTKSFWKSQCYLKTEPSNHFDFCDQMKREMDKTFRTNLNSVVKKSCRTKYRFYILATSDDVFFEHTKAQLEAEGHTAVQPAEFFLGEDSSSSLLIILRNEDIAEHICEVPHLLELKKTPGVHFAGIDEPDDVVNLTHQELFTQGGFIMFDRAAVDSLSLCNMKKVSEILLELSKMGKWKWMLHYRDSRRLKENARLSAEAKEKKHFLCWGQDAGILEVLPYHDCDQMSRDQPDYLSCLVRLQVQKISSRYSVFITDMPTDSTFEKNGILTMTSNAFLTKPLSETFTV